MAARQSTQRKVGALCGAVLLKRLQGIGGTGGFEAAGRAQRGAKQQAVPFDKGDQYGLRQAPEHTQEMSHVEWADVVIIASGAGRAEPHQVSHLCAHSFLQHNRCST